jgi:hypothetical protein
MRLGCYDLMGVDSKTLEPFIFISFVKNPKFGTRLK